MIQNRKNFLNKSLNLIILCLILFFPISSQDFIISDNGGNSNLTAVYYDPTTVTTNELTNMFREAQELTNVEMSFIPVLTKLDLISQIKTKYEVELFIFHGNEKGFNINTEFMSWLSFAKIAKGDYTNYYVFLFCNSDPLKSLLENKTVLSYTGTVDKNVAFFDALKFLSGFYRDSLYQNHVKGKSLFEFAINFIKSEGADFYNRLIKPVDSLNILDVQDSLQYGIYASMYEGIGEDLTNLQQIANKAGADQYIKLVENWVSLFILSSTSVMTYGFPVLAIGSIELALSYISQTLDRDSSLSDSSVASEACDLYCNNILGIIISKFPGSSSFNPGGSLVRGLSFFFGIHAFVEKYSYEEQSCSGTCQVSAQYVEAALRGHDDFGITRYPNINEKLDDFVDALYNDWDNVLSTANQLLDELNDFSTSSTWSGVIYSLAAETVNKLKVSVQDFINSVYHDIDTDASDNAWIEFDWDVDAGYYDTTIDIDYTFNHYGGNQIGVTQTYIQATGPKGTNSQTNTFQTWFALPGQVISGHFTLSKDWGHASVTLNYKGVEHSMGDDFKGESITAKIDGNKFFPYGSYAQLTFNLDGINTFNQIFVSLARVLDIYSRYFRVYANGYKVFETVVGYYGYYGQIDLWWDVTSVTLEIYWGGVPGGWLVQQIKLFSECNICV